MTDTAGGRDATIRTCEPGDLPAVAVLYERWVGERITQNLAADTVRTLTPRLGEFFLVAQAEALVVGFLIGELKPAADDAYGRDAFGAGRRYLEVQDLYVAPAHRDAGIGTALMAEVLRRAESHGVRESLVYSANVDYARTARFYEKAGYRMWHIFMTRGRGRARAKKNPGQARG